MSDPFKDPQWIDYAKHVIDNLAPMIRDSEVTVSLAPKGETDIKFAVELGLSIMMDKPILVVLQPGAKLPSKLARVADDVIEVDLDAPTVAARRIREAVGKLLADDQ